MKKGCVLLALLLGALVARADVPLPTWDDDAAKAWWAQNPTPDKWPQAVDQLRAQLEANYKSDGASALSNSDFQGWLEHLEWVQLGLDCPDVLDDTGNLKTFVALGNDPAVSHLFVRKLDPRNVKKEALLNLLRLAQANLDDLNTYAALGVAFASSSTSLSRSTGLIPRSRTRRCPSGTSTSCSASTFMSSPTATTNSSST